MKTIQITIDNDLLDSIDRQCGNRNRSSFFRQAAQLFLKHLKTRELEMLDYQGYKQHPVGTGEFDVWHDEQVWTE